METRKNHILFSWILLICFAAGQYMIYAHQHNYRLHATRVHVPIKTIPHNSFKEKCSLCDVMHHNNMETGAGTYLSPATRMDYVFKEVSYSFTSIQLILAAGRAPPYLA